LKILYAIQATGNGHISRAKELVPCLRKRAETDILVSGLDSDVELPFDVKYRLRGYGFFFGTKGGINFWKTFRKFSFLGFINEIIRLPIRQYDLIITDFEPVSAWAAFFGKKYCAGIGNQYTLNLPEFKAPKGKYFFSRFILKHYTPVDKIYPMFYRSLTPSVILPLIRPEIRQMEPRRGNYYLVYLSAFDNKSVKTFLEKHEQYSFRVFAKKHTPELNTHRIRFYPIDQEHFSESLEKCAGVLTHAGFGLTSEALYLGKKLCVIPMRQQYEQICNAAYLSQELRITTFDNLETGGESFKEWLKAGKPQQVYFPNHAQKLADTIITDYLMYENFFLRPAREEMAAALH
jgi:uncharacterized protein (TIGR00661 family)